MVEPKTCAIFNFCFSWSEDKLLTNIFSRYPMGATNSALWLPLGLKLSVKFTHLSVFVFNGVEG
jgi:hypothetical protein